jgi:hypothetical protein
MKKNGAYEEELVEVYLGSCLVTEDNIQFTNKPIKLDIPSKKE